MKLSTALALSLTLTPLLHAQSTRVLPSSNYRSNPGSWGLALFGSSTRAQLLVEGGLFCKSSALLREVAFRRDSGTRNYPRYTIQQLEVNVGVSTRNSRTLSRTFASNWLQPPATVFKGKYSLPASLGGVRLHPFNFRIRFTRLVPYLRRNGELLIELSHSGGLSYLDHILDSVRESSQARLLPFGKSGKFASGEESRLGGLTSWPTIGSIVQIGVIPELNSPYPTLLFMGASNRQYRTMRLPFDLRPLGAAGNQLYISLDVAAPLILTRLPDDFGGNARIAIPPMSGLSQASLYFQAIHLDRGANALGLVFSAALELQLEKWAPFASLLGSRGRTTGIRYFLIPITELTGHFN